jgi:hypothetical protein
MGRLQAAWGTNHDNDHGLGAAKMITIFILHSQNLSLEPGIVYFDDDARWRGVALDAFFDTNCRC